MVVTQLLDDHQLLHEVVDALDVPALLTAVDLCLPESEQNCIGKDVVSFIIHVVKLRKAALTCLPNGCALDLCSCRNIVAALRSGYTPILPLLSVMTMYKSPHCPMFTELTSMLTRCSQSTTVLPELRQVMEECACRIDTRDVSAIAVDNVVRAMLHGSNSDLACVACNTALILCTRDVDIAVK
eukprot:gene12325-2249_t